MTAPTSRNRTRASARTASRSTKSPVHPRDQAQAALRALEAMSTNRDRENLARFGITAHNALGVSMANVQRLAKRLGHSHALAVELWKTGCYEARLLTSFVDEAARVTPSQMDRWCRDFDNWGVCDTVCFHLFDRTPHAWSKVEQWHDQRGEFVRRAAFALLASLALHDKSATDARFIEGLVLIERGASDERNFVKKGVSWALRLIGRRNRALHARALVVARRLAASPDAASRWVGNGAVRELEGAIVMRRLAALRRRS